MQQLMPLTQYSQDSVYNSYQIRELAEKINATIAQSPRDQVGNTTSLSTKAVTFNFKLTQLDPKEGYDAHSHTLESIEQHIDAKIGAKIILCCHGTNGAWRQGDIAVITRIDKTTGVWAKFDNGLEWPLGKHGSYDPDFLVIESAPQ
ncbi:hypothetical protein F7U66_01280 [Vibrio parahaemolyticus]|nr:hypothetical protein [Vibrio parahaemolyticus]